MHKLIQKGVVHLQIAPSASSPSCKALNQGEDERDEVQSLTTQGKWNQTPDHQSEKPNRNLRDLPEKTLQARSPVPKQSELTSSTAHRQRCVELFSERVEIPAHKHFKRNAGHCRGKREKLVVTSSQLCDAKART